MLQPKMGLHERQWSAFELEAMHLAAAGHGMKPKPKFPMGEPQRVDIIHYSPSLEDKSYDVTDIWAICPKTSWRECWQTRERSKRVTHESLFPPK